MNNRLTVATIGEILVEFVSHQRNCGLRVISDYSGPYPSGAPAIFLDQAARMGGTTEMIGGVGDDGFGHSVLERLKEDGVGTNGITVSPNLSTGTAFVSYYDTGARDFIFHLSNTAADHFDVPATLLDPANTVLHVSASSLGAATMRGMIMQAVVALWVLMIVARVFRRAATRGVDRIPNLSRLLKKFIATAVYWATFVFGILIVLGLFGINVTPLFAVFGGLSFILGFALQDTLGNLASGLMIMVLKPFDTGDYIEVGGSSGFVDEMSIVSTRIRTFDNQIIVVPNSKIWGDVITNVSASPERRVDLVFGIGYTDKAQHAIDVLKDLIAAHPMCLKNPEPEVFVGELGDSSVNIFCRPWSKSDDYWTVYWDLTGQAKERFDSEGISIPFPQRDVHLITANSDQSEPA